MALEVRQERAKTDEKPFVPFRQTISAALRNDEKHVTSRYRPNIVPTLPSIHVVFLFNLPQDCGHHEQGYEASGKCDEKLLQFQLWVLTEGDLGKDFIERKTFRILSLKIVLELDNPNNTVIWMGERKSYTYT